MVRATLGILFMVLRRNIKRTIDYLYCEWDMWDYPEGTYIFRYPVAKITPKRIFFYKDVEILTDDGRWLPTHKNIRSRAMGYVDRRTLINKGRVLYGHYFLTLSPPHPLNEYGPRFGIKDSSEVEVSAAKSTSMRKRRRVTKRRLRK